MCICQSQSPNLSLPTLSPGNYKIVFYICSSISVLYISSFVPFFQYILALNTFSELCYLEIGAISVIILVPKKLAVLDLCVLAMGLLIDQNLIFVSVPANVTRRTSPRVSPL